LSRAAPAVGRIRYDLVGVNDWAFLWKLVFTAGPNAMPGAIVVPAKIMASSAVT